MSPTDFDRLTIFVAAIDEMLREPFFSEDLHESIETVESGLGKKVRAKLCHPAFVKSAILPFRKIWLSSELSTFDGPKGSNDGIRDMVFEHIEQFDLVEKWRLPGLRERYFDDFEMWLSMPPNWDQLPPITQSTRDVIAVWINTEIAHCGRKLGQKKPSSSFERKDFERMCEEIGRERFEYQFHCCMRFVAGMYKQFAQDLAIPLYERLKTQGSTPSFEGKFALKYMPYADTDHNIIYSDHFWHLDKESPSETFDRLLGRNLLSAIGSFLSALFPRKTDAITAVTKCGSLTEILDSHNFTEAIEDPPRETLRGECSSCMSGRPEDVIFFSVYAGGKFQFKTPTTADALSRAFETLRKLYLEGRECQRVKVPEDKWPSSHPFD